MTFVVTSSKILYHYEIYNFHLNLNMYKINICRIAVIWHTQRYFHSACYWNRRILTKLHAHTHIQPSASPFYKKLSVFFETVEVFYIENSEKYWLYLLKTAVTRIHEFTASYTSSFPKADTFLMFYIYINVMGQGIF